MKISDRTIDDLLTLLEHAKKDISFREGGSYCYDNGKGPDFAFDVKAAKKAERAIEFIKKLILQRDI